MDLKKMNLNFEGFTQERLSKQHLFGIQMKILKSS